MSEFSVIIPNARSIVVKNSKIADDLGRISGEIYAVKSGLSFEIASKNRISQRLKELSEKTALERESMKKCSGALSEILVLYEQNEKAVLGEDTGLQMGKEEGLAEKYIPKLLQGIVGKAGIVGGVASAVWQFWSADKANGTDWAKSIAKLGKDLLSTRFNIGEASQKVKNGTSTVWKEALGLSVKTYKEAEKLTGAKAFKAAYKASWKESVGKLKTAKGIGGLALSFVGNAIGNYQEMQDEGISKERAVAETVVETAVDWGKDAAIAAGVAGALAATGVGLPAVAVGAIAVGVGVGIDWACEKVFGKTFTEGVSDLIIDGAEHVGKAVSEAATVVAEKVGEAANAVKEGVTTAWNSITGGLKAAYGW